MLAITRKQTLTSAIVRRLSQIQSSNHELIRLLGIIYFGDGEYPTRDADVMERNLHNEFSHLCRFKAYMRGAEWFSESPELLEHIERVATKPKALNLPEFFSEQG